MAERIWSGGGGAEQGRIGPPVAGAGLPPGRVPCTAVIPLPEGLVARDEVHRALVRLRDVAHPHVAPLLSADVRDEGVAVVHALERGWSPLGTWLADGASLTAGQAVTLGVPLAQALAALHGAGLACGAVGPDDVAVGPDGRPELVVRRPGPLGPHSAADEVAALAAFLRDLMPTGSAPGSLALALVRAADPADEVVADGAAFADALLRASVPEPLVRAAAPEMATAAEGVLAPPGDGSAPQPEAPAAPGAASGATAATAATAAPTDPIAGLRRSVRRTDPVRVGRSGAARAAGRDRPAGHRVRSVAEPPPPTLPSRGGLRRRLGRPLAATALVALLAVGIAVVVALRLMVGPAAQVVAAAAAEPTAEEAPPAATGAASSRPAPAAQGGGGWGPLVAGLDRRRAEAFASADPARLAAAVVPGSPAGRDDLAAVQALRRSGLRPVGLVWEVDAIDVVSSSATAATLRVVDHQRAYRLVDVAGRVRESRPSRAQRRWLVGLTREWPGPWRVWSVVPG